MLINAFSQSHKDCAKLLASFSQDPDLSALYVEVLLSQILTLPAPKHKQMYYACLVIDMCKLLTPFPVHLERAINRLFASMHRLGVQLAERFADWLAFHISSFPVNQCLAVLGH